MNALHEKHPSLEQLSDFGLGRLDDAASAAIEVHLLECASCRTVVEQVPNDTLLSLLRQPGLDPAATAASCSAASEAKLPPELADHTRYQILQLLGRGGMGAVYKAEHRLMERLVALKLINPALMKRPVMVERFRREVKAAARFSHPNIVRAYDADQAGDAHFLVMEFVEGTSLAQQVERHGPLPVEKACDYIRQAALGLQFAAEHGMVHRDIKPHNLMLTPDEQVKILDFGLARLVREQELNTDAPDEANPGTSLTDAGMVIGTADYIAPEQVTDPAHADSRADVYSLGCTLYFLLAGHSPFPEGTAAERLRAHRERQPIPLSKVRSDIPSGLASVLERMLAKDPAQRYQTSGQVAEALRPFTPAAAAVRRRVKQALVAALALAATLLLGAVIYVQTDNGELIIQAESDKVAVMVQDGSVKVRDEAANREYRLSIGRHRLRPGEYALDVKELPAGVEFETTSPFILKRGGTTTLSVVFRAKKAAGYLKDEALRWFPGGATFFIVQNMEVFPDITRLPFLIMADRGGEQTRRFLDVVGRLDRSSFAWVVNPQDPSKGRSFMRLTGKIARDRVIDHFRRQWGGTFQQASVDGGAVLILHDSKPGGAAVALVGTTDLILASISDPSASDVPAVEECLALRAGRGTTLPAAQAAILKEIPDDAWEFAVGTAPEFFKNQYAFPFMRPIRWGIMSFSGTSDVEMRCRGSLGSAAEAQQFRLTTEVMKHVFMNAPLVMNDAELAAAVTKTFESARFDTEGERFNAYARIPSRAWTALVEKIADMPLRELIETPAFSPAKKAARTQGVVVLRGHVDKVTAVAFTPAGRQALSSSDDRTIRLWEVATGKQLGVFPVDELMVLSVAIAPDGRRALSSPGWPSEGSADESIRVWDVGSGQRVARLTGHTHGVWKVVYSADGKLALSGSQDRTVRLWDVESEREVRRFVGHDDAVRSVALSPDGRHALSGSWDKTVRLWDVASGKELRRFSGMLDRVNAVAISPDGRFALAAGGSVADAVDTDLHLWDLATGAELRRFAGHSQRVWCVAFSPDSRRILSGSADATLRLWDVAGGQALATYAGHTSDVRCVAFAPDGKSALSGSHDQTLQLWNLP